MTGFTAGCVLVSNMIGTGIFGTTGFMAADLGTAGWILFLWVLGGAYSLLGVFAYGELSAAMPRSGGEYVYIREAYGPLLGFLSGWTSFTVGFSAAIASAAHLFADHLRQFLPFSLPFATNGGGVITDRVIIGLAMVWALTLVHVAGVVAGGFMQRLLTVLKVGSIVLLIVAGLALGTGEWDNLARSDLQVSFSLETTLVAFMFVTFSYSGWNAASYIAGEIEEPRRSLPWAMIWGTVTVCTLYVLLNVVYLYALPMSELAAEPTDLVGHKSAQALFRSGAGHWITLLLTISILAAASAMIWAGPRIYHAMAEDGLFPHWFAERSKATGVPARSIVLQSAWISVLLVSGTFESLVLYTTFVIMVFAALGVSAVMVLRVKRPDLPRPFKAWTYPWGPAAYLALTAAILWSALDLRPIESLLGAVTVVAGVPFYFFWRRRSAITRPRETL